MQLPTMSICRQCGLPSRVCRNRCRLVLQIFKRKQRIVEGNVRADGPDGALPPKPGLVLWLRTARYCWNVSLRLDYARGRWQAWDTRSW